ncbi:MAG: VOC family protein, partial [Mariniphaga sp.]|nr:VOC family protein [Mariniphaga sp.]
GKVSTNPAGTEHFFLKDSFGNLWEVIKEKEVFKKEKSVTGGVLGVTIGVKNMNDSLKIYHDLLGYDKVVYDQQGIFSDFQGISGGEGSFRRVLLRHSELKNGAFSTFFGSSYIELIESTDQKPRDIYIGRIWGDPGFIHICFDINGIDYFRKKAKSAGFPFTVDSSIGQETFDMGEAAGSFAYIQAPEGTLIEFVETHKIPILKKIGWFIDLRKRGNHPLPNWLLKLFRFKRVKE